MPFAPPPFAREISLEEVSFTAPPAKDSKLIPLAASPLVDMLPEVATLTAPSLATTTPSTKSSDVIIPKGLDALTSVRLPVPKNKIPGCPLPIAGVMSLVSVLTLRTVVPGGGFSTPADWLPEQVTVPTPVHGSGPACTVAGAAAHSAPAATRARNRGA